MYPSALIRYKRPIYCSNECILIYEIPLTVSDSTAKGYSKLHKRCIKLNRGSF